MKPILMCAALGLLAAGCASPRGATEAEAAFAAAAASASSAAAGFLALDQPLRVLRAPQPTMSADDIDHKVSGEVVVLIQFDEIGKVDSAAITSSIKESLSEAVLAAVRQWEISPRLAPVHLARSLRGKISGL